MNINVTDAINMAKDAICENESLASLITCRYALEQHSGSVDAGQILGKLEDEINRKIMKLNYSWPTE